MKRILSILFFFVLSSKLYAQPETSFITLLPDNTILNSIQQTEFNKISSNVIFHNPHLVKIENFEIYNTDGTLRISLPFLPQTDILYNAVNINFDNNQNYYYNGSYNSNDDEDVHSSISLTLLNNTFAGSIIFDEHNYEIHDLGGGVICISELNVAYIDEHDCSPLKDEPIAEKSTRGPCAAQYTKILVIYNDDALSVNGNIPSLAQEGLNQLHTIWNQSDISNSATIVTRHHNFTRTQDIASDISDLSNNNSIKYLRDFYDADIVVLMVGNPYGGTNGIVANIGGGYNDAYCIVSAVHATSGRRTFAHEITHLYGGRHDDDPDPTDANGHTFHTGFLGLGKKRFTLMAQMPAGKSRIDHISNPNIDFNNKATGSSDCNNASTVNSMINTIANFKQDPSLLLDANITWPLIYSCSDHPTVTISGECGEPPYTYLWQKSTNGIIWTNVSTNNWAHISLPIGNAYSYIKYRVYLTDATNTTVLKTKDYNVHCYGDHAKMIEMPTVNEIQEIKINPNPNKGNFSITFENENEFYGEIRVEIIDMTGKLIYNKKIINLNNIVEVNDLSELSKGNYILKVSNELNASKSLKLSIY